MSTESNPAIEQLHKDAYDLFESAYWYELQLARNADPGTVYLRFHESATVLSYHHFWDEPWHRKRWVVRAAVNHDREDAFSAMCEDLCEEGVVEDWVYWAQQADDKALYGDFFPTAMALFQASSALAYYPNQPFITDKLVHCVLNAHGQSDIRWAVRYIARRLRMYVRLGWRRLGR